jgi:hypothetical protein
MLCFALWPGCVLDLRVSLGRKQPRPFRRRYTRGRADAARACQGSTQLSIVSRKTTAFGNTSSMPEGGYS